MSTTVRERIRARRQQLGLSQEQLAARLQTLGLDVTRHWVSDLERGHTRMPDWDCICYVAAALQTDPNTLLGWDEFRSVLRS